MSRHGGQDADGVYGDDGTWLPGGYGEPPDDDQARVRRAAGHDQDPYRRTRGSTRISQDPGSETGPPWAEAIPPWERVTGDDTGIPLPRLGPADLSGGHPSGPLPSLPPAQDWPEPATGFGYADGGGEEYGYHGNRYPGYPDDGGDAGYPGHGQAGGYQDAHEDTGYGYPGYAEGGYDRGGGYQEAEYQAGYPDTGTGFPAVGHDYPAGAGFDDTGTGYVHPAYRDDRFTAGRAGYPEGGGYPADDDAYTDHGQATAGRPDRGDDHGYPEAGGWYGDVDDEHEWADDDYEDDDAFLPGLSTDTRRRAGSRPGERGASRGGQRSGKGGGKGGGKGRKSGKRKRGMRRVAPWLALTVLLGLLIGAGGGYFYVYRTYLHPPDYPGSGTGSLVVRIYPGDTAGAVGQRLQLAGVVASARAFTNAAKASGHGSGLEPGYYRVHLHMKAALVFGLLLKQSSRVQTKITIPEGKRLSWIIATLGRETGNPHGYQQAIRDVKALNLPSFAKGSPEGYLFPATYEVQPNTPPIKTLQSMVTRFDMEAASISLPSAAAHALLTQGDVIIVASLVQAEGRNPADFPKIAEVIYNRLNSSPQIPLQLDSTVMYALNTYGIRASSAQTKVKSAYNTYRNTGLPPGPIDSPGDAAIQAALKPAHGNLLYFVTVDPKTGLTKFTSSFTVAQQFEAELTANLAKGR